jgi:outer membrane protein assembly factor BamE (lipoprotein component of BamABCDE complex)
MRRTISVTIVVAVLVAVSAGCSSKSPEEKAVEEAVAALQEIAGEIESSAVSTVSRETAKAWAEKFCTLEIDMTREQVRAIMGEPTSIFEDSYANQDSYEAWGYSLTIFYDIDNLAQQIQPNSDNVPCDTKFRE